MENSIVLIGCGTLAEHVIEIFQKRGRSVSHVFDPIGAKVGQRFRNHVIEDFSEYLRLQEDAHEGRRWDAVICLGDSKLKKRLFDQLPSTSNFINAIHPSSEVSPWAKVGVGIIMKAHSIIELGSQVGNGCIIHSKTIVGHDSVVGDFVSLGAAVTICGHVTIGDNATVYTGSILSPDVRVGGNSVIGAGSLVLNDIPSNVLAYGAPARVIREIEGSGEDGNMNGVPIGCEALERSFPLAASQGSSGTESLR